MVISESNPARTDDQRAALALVAEQFEQGIAATKCHCCGCFQAAVASFETTQARQELAEVLVRARRVLAERKYDCLGCDVCFPAVAENAFGDAFPDESIEPTCPTDVPEARRGWPPLPGNYKIVRFGAPVAVCTLNTPELMEKLAASAPDGLALAGTLHTENLGIERVIQNVLSNPNIRFVVVCGEDTQQAVGHLPGQSLVALWENGVDMGGRIAGALGKKPILKNVTKDEVEAFRRQVELVPFLGELEPTRITLGIEACATRNPGTFHGAPARVRTPVVFAKEPARLVLDPAGFVVVYPDATRGLVVEHYANDGVLETVIEGPTPAAVGATAVERGVISRLDHAVYLGRELARAHASLVTGEPYVQDRAPEAAPEPEPSKDSCTGKT